jgi:hypothetical protein
MPPGERRNQLADRETIGGDRPPVGEEVAHLEAVGVEERAIEQRRRHLEVEQRAYCVNE